MPHALRKKLSEAPGRRKCHLQEGLGLVKLKQVVLETALPASTFGATTQEAWQQMVPLARFLADSNELSYDPTTQLVRIKRQAKTIHVHISRVLFMELEETVAQRLETMSLAEAHEPLMRDLPPLSPPKKRGMPKGGWPKKVAPHVPGALEPPKEPT